MASFGMTDSIPLQTGYLEVGDGHRLYFEEHGNPAGAPVVVLHGGPGAGCSRKMVRFFEPNAFRIILFDQRGAGKSEPHACLEKNTTWDLVDDINRLRTHLNIDAWLVFGGSWGSTLALTYAIVHPQLCSGLILRGVFLSTKPELDWFYQGGAGRFFTAAYRSFCSLIPKDERDDLIAAYYRRLLSDDDDVANRHAMAWANYEMACARLQPNPNPVRVGIERFATSLARIEAHYFLHASFFPEPEWIRSRLSTIADIPTHIVQGQYDMICPPQTAYEVADTLDNAELRIVEAAGHSTGEDAIASALLDATSAWLRSSRGRR